MSIMTKFEVYKNAFIAVLFSLTNFWTVLNINVY